MRMVVVESRTVRQDKVAFHVMEREGAMDIASCELIFLFILLQARDSETARIFMWILTGIIPPPLERGGQMSTHEFH